MDQRFTEDLQADELEPVEIVMALEEDLGISVTDQEAAGISTVGDLVDFVARKQIGSDS